MDRMTYQLSDQNGNPSGKYVFSIDYDHYKYQYASTEEILQLVLRQLAKYEEADIKK